ncbi:MAG: hypothetical protein HY268_03930 [Deltaproteobacteria bacterium]|nr:hypothetical protein [Deltaproteobacteria bacterium]
MQNHYFMIGITLGLLLMGGLGRAEAKSRHFVSHQAGTGVNGVIDTNGDGMTAGTFTGIANTTLGRFLFQGESESLLDALATNISCPVGTAEFPLLQALDVFTLQATGEQLFLTHTSGAVCFDFTTLTFTYHTQGTFSGGTGRFVHAAGTFDNNGTGSVLVFDLPAFHTLLNTTGTVTGTLTGVKDIWD